MEYFTWINSSMWAALVSMLFTKPVYACDGPELMSIQDRFEEASVVVEIEVTQVKISGSDSSKVEGTARIVDAIKRQVSGDLVILGYMPTMDCWTQITVGERYIAFLPNRIGRFDVWFSVFSPTVEISEVPEPVLRSWRSN